MPEDQINPEIEPVEQLENGTLPELTTEDPSGNPLEPSTDPFDSITDPVVRAEAKKHRAIATRLSKKSETTPAPAAPVVTDTLTKADLHRINSQKAIRQLKADPEMAEHADDIIKAYVNRRGQDDETNIFEDLKEAYAVVMFRKGPATAGNPAAELQTTVKVPTSSKPTETAPAKGGLLKSKQDISSWYPKKQ